MQSPPGGRIGPYQLVRELGRGGMGIVFLARDPAGRDVALKTLLTFDPQGLERFRREAEALALLDHPAIVKVHAAGEADGRPYLVCELIEGATPFDVATASLPLDQRVRLVRDACRGLGHAHAQGIVHRDVKPDNLLVGADGRVRVTDFGLVLLEQRDRLTRTGAMVGTPVTMSPEQLVGGRAGAGPAADVWSLGVVLYQALTGVLPFDGDTLPALCLQIDEANPVPPRQRAPDVSASLEAVCLRALARSPAERWADGAAMADALDAALGGERIAAPRRPRRRGSRWVVAALAPVVGLAALAAVFELAPASPEGTAPAVATVASAAPTETALLAPALRTTDLEHASLAGWTLVPTTVDRLEVVASALRGERVELRVESFAADSSTAEPLRTKQLEVPLEAGTSRREVPLAIGWNVITLRAPRTDRVLDRRDVVRLPADLELVSGTHVRARKAGSSLRLVPPGTLLRRDDDRERARVLSPYFLGTYEVSNADFARYRATGVVPAPELPLSSDDLPICHVSDPDTHGYCDWAGLRLATAVEWERAALDQAGGNLAGPPFEGPCAVNDETIPGARARWGHWHLVGNASESVQYLHVSDGKNEMLVPGALGGSFMFAPGQDEVRGLFFGERRPDGGFRVARGVGADRGDFHKVKTD